MWQHWPLSSLKFRQLQLFRFLYNWPLKVVWMIRVWLASSYFKSHFCETGLFAINFLCRRFFFENCSKFLEPRLVLGEGQDGLVEVGRGLTVDGDGVGRRVRLDTAPQRATEWAVAAHAGQPAEARGHVVAVGTEAIVHGVNVAHPTQASAQGSLITSLWH